MRKAIILTMLAAVLLLASCAAEPTPERTTCKVDLYNMSMRLCGWRITRGLDEISPLEVYPRTEKISFQADKGEDYSIEFYVLDPGTYGLGVGSVITENAIIDSMIYDFSTGSDMSSLMFTYDDADGIDVKRLDI